MKPAPAASLPAPRHLAPRLSRRSFAASAGAALALPMLGGGPAQAAAGRIVVIGAGFGGASCARTLRRLMPTAQITVLEPAAQIITCPFSNLVLSGLAEMDSITHGLDGLAATGVRLVQAAAQAIDADRRDVVLHDGTRLGYDRLVVSPGVEMRLDAIEGYDEAATQIMPHAWKAGPQTMLLRQKLQAMDDGGVVAIAVPANPYRCPPGPYERASLIAHYLKTYKPRSKLLVIDAKDSFSKQPLFLQAWADLYGDLVEWVPFAKAGSLLRVDAASGGLTCEFAQFQADVANVIPPQRAGVIAQSAGLIGPDGWCTVDATTFESDRVAGVHVLGDAIVAGAMPKSGFAASVQGKACAHAIASLMHDQVPLAPSFINTCYSLVGPDYGISVADVFRVGSSGKIEAVRGAGGISPRDASAQVRVAEAEYARGWYASITTDIWG